MKNRSSIAILTGILISFGACERQETTHNSNDNTDTHTNTLGDNLSGATGSINDYFYNFENDVNAEFYRYGPNLMKNYDGYATYYGLFGEDPPIMTFETFPDYLVSMDSGDEDLFTERHYIDSLSVQDSIVPDTVLMRNTPFKNLESLSWDLEAEPSLQRYKLLNSDWVSIEDTIPYLDTFDVSAYWAVVDTPFISEGILFVDSSEWHDTNYVFLNDEQIRFVKTFQFERQQLSNDSLVFRQNTDCNDNGEWDEAESTIEDYNGDGIYEFLYEYSDNNNNGEYDAGDDVIEDYDGDGSIGIAYEFTDTGNGVWDPAEPFYDTNEDGAYDLSEPYQDRNCNNKWDESEAYTDSDSSGDYTNGEPFVDVGNALFDDTEEFTLKDADGDGEAEKHLYLIGDKPNNLIVNWADSNNPEVLLQIELDDDVTSRWGTTYNDLIETTDFYDVKQSYVNDMDSLVTLFTREKVGHIKSQSLSPDDYYITKSEWSKSSGGETERFYNYHIFHEPNHLNQIEYPSYFLPLGFYWSAADFQNGFWQKNQLQSDVLYYTYNGQLRDGEHVDTSYFDTTGIAVYFIEKSYRVESDAVTVPAGAPATDGEMQEDVTFTDCFKVTQQLTMTMVGSGVDFGQRTESWLVKDKGLVKSEIYIRWTEHPYDSDITPNGPPDENNEAWVGLNRIELKSVDMTPESGVFRQLTQPAHDIELRHIQDNADFDYDPFILSPQTGIQTLDLRELSE